MGVLGLLNRGNITDMSQTEEIWTNYFFSPKKIYFGITNYVEKNEKFIIFSYSDDRNYDSHIHINSYHMRGFLRSAEVNLELGPSFLIN